MEDDGQLTPDDIFVVVDSSLNPVTLTLPAAYENPGFEVCIKYLNGGLNPVTVLARNGETIDGASSLSLTANNSSAHLFSDGENW